MSSWRPGNGPPPMHGSYLIALTHSSWSHEQGGPDNERLEFLGDAVLELYTRELLCESFPEDSEGTLSRKRQQLVNTAHVARLARLADLGPHVRLGKGEEHAGGRTREKLLAGLYEAVLAALFLDQGPEVAREVIYQAQQPWLSSVRQLRNPKVQLQQWAQRTHQQVPSYVLLESCGPAHAQDFYVEVQIDSQPIARAWGSRKKKAEANAAQLALIELGELPPSDGDTLSPAARPDVPPAQDLLRTNGRGA